MMVEVLLWGALLLLLWLSFFRKPSGLPPGRWGLPLVGYIPLTTKSLQQQLTDLRKKHGDIYLWRMGTQVIVFLHDHKLIKEAFNRPEYQARPNWDVFKLREVEAKGIIATDGIHWHNNRRFTLKQLRDLGMGKSKLVAAVHTQATQLVQELKKQAGRPAPMPHALRVAVVNIIWQMVGGKQFSITDPKLKEFEEITTSVLAALGRQTIPDLFPWLHTVLPAFVLIRLFQLDVLDHTREKFLEYFNEEIEEHRATLDRDDPRDLIDGYLMEMEERKDDPDTTFKEDDLGLLIFDLFFAGSETTNDTLIWMIYFLATNPKVQRKMQAEIDEVLPQGTLATLMDRPRLPYVEAVIHETLRKSSLSALGVLHMTTQDSTLGGYVIPKGTILSSSNVLVHHNTRYWDRPDQFRPERWLDHEGKIETKVEGFMPFNIGKRQCVGEGLARMELLIFSTAVFQSLSFAIPPGKTLSLDPAPGNPFIQNPIQQDLIVTVRN